MVTQRAATVRERRWDQVLSGLRPCFRVGTERTAWEPVCEILVQTLLRDAQQSVDASALQVCHCVRGVGAVLGFG